MVILHQQGLISRIERTPSGWALDDSRAFLRLILPVRDLDASIDFYFNILGMEMRQKLDLEGGSQRAIVSSSLNSERFALELVQVSDIQHANRGLEHITLVVDSTAAVLERMRSAGYEDLIIKEVAAVIPVKNPSKTGPRSLTDQVSLVADVNGYHWQLMELKGQQPPTDKMCSVALHVNDLELSLKWYANVLGVNVNEHYEAKEDITSTVHKSALVGYASEFEATMLELRQVPFSGASTPDLTQSIRMVLATKDLAATKAAIEGQGESWRDAPLGSETDPTKTVPAVEVTDPDGWAFVFIEKELWK